MRTITLSAGQVHMGSLIIVNRDHQCPELLQEMEPLRKTHLQMEGTSSIRLLRRAAVLFTGLMDEIGGWEQIIPVSGYRTLKEQTSIWEDSLAKNGQAFTDAYVAFPGHSEHQTGLALDLGVKSDSIDFLCPDFPDTGICLTFRERAPEYGFIRRYPAGKESVTGIGHEPWHFRYVGTPHGEIMEREKLTLEEYLLFLRNFPYGKRPFLFTKGERQISVSWKKADKNGTTQISVSSRLPYAVSGDNIDGFIITEWRG